MVNLPMRLSSWVIACVALVFSCNVWAKAYLEPGVDDYNDMVQMLGKPQKIEATPDGRNFYYSGIVVNISGADQSTILTISYLKPNLYQRYLNLDVGMTAEAIKWQLDDYYEHKEAAYHFITDYRRSVIFWIGEGKVSKMVQARPNSLKRLR